MGWIIIDVGENEIYRFFSIREEVGIIHDGLIGFIFGLTPGFYALLVALFAASTVAWILFSMKSLAMKSKGDKLIGDDRSHPLSPSKGVGGFDRGGNMR